MAEDDENKEKKRRKSKSGPVCQRHVAFLPSLSATFQQRKEGSDGEDRERAESPKESQAFWRSKKEKKKEMERGKKFFSPYRVIRGVAGECSESPLLSLERLPLFFLRLLCFVSSPFFSCPFKQSALRRAHGARREKETPRSSHAFLLLPSGLPFPRCMYTAGSGVCTLLFRLVYGVQHFRREEEEEQV